MLKTYLRLAALAAAPLSVTVVAGPALAGTYLLTVSAAAMEIDPALIQIVRCRRSTPRRSP